MYVYMYNYMYVTEFAKKISYTRIQFCDFEEA